MDTFSDFMNYLDRNSDSMKKDLKLDKTSSIYKFYRDLFIHINQPEVVNLVSGITVK